MGGGKILSVEEITKILAFREVNLGLREIARKLGRSLCVVQNFFKNPDNYNRTKKGRPTRKLTARDKRRIINTASNSTSSCSKIKSELSLNVSKSTVCASFKGKSDYCSI